MPVGRITRGTTGTNRLRRNDRYLASLPQLRGATAPLVVDLGYGARPWTTLELAERLRRVSPDVRVLGLEIDPERVAAAAPHASASVTFAQGGFEIPSPSRPVLVRAMNVLRQYDEAEVPAAWARTAARLAPGGLLVDGTCDEIGRICSWIDVAEEGPVRFTISLRLAGLESPGVVAERLPKALIHRNVPGEPVHDLLAAFDDGWRRAAPLSVYGPVQRFVAAVEALRDRGVPVQGGRSRWRLGELTVPWKVVAPR
ncbi:class I SAM-dependent methyltransferase [uncultured Amnibacterium sp.]|uniref:class I SAM-dependent methyltransferase n=1 Tax=uncultured Amnibacterium sp. TaxID=1631851 RepID=UPI0035CBB038